MGQDFIAIPELPQTTSQNTFLADWIAQLQSTWPVVHKALKEAHEKYKKQADKKTRSKPKDFNIGNTVYLSTKYLQSRESSKKLGSKYTGYFPIIKIINPVTVVQLDLPPKPQTHSLTLPLVAC